jgi:uncharacterized protein YbjT (DUF2867 family)
VTVAFKMRVFLTGATGFIGSFLVPELTNVGHHVVGLSHSDAGAEALTSAGAEVFRGDVNDLDRLRNAAEAADGVIHAAFNRGRLAFLTTDGGTTALPPDGMIRPAKVSRVEF